MNELTGYVVARSINPNDDVMTLLTGKIYFNRADALEAAEGRHIFQITLPFPQDGKGNA